MGTQVAIHPAVDSGLTIAAADLVELTFSPFQIRTFKEGSRFYAITHT